MSVLIELSDHQAAALETKAAAQGLTLEAWIQKLADSNAHESNSNAPLRSGYGMLAKYGHAPSAEEIDEIRREMFRGFAEDI